MEDRSKVEAVEPQPTTPAGGESGFFSDLSKIRIAPDYAERLGVKRILSHVPVRRPDRQWWVRVHSHEAYRIDGAVLELKDEGETYYVHPSLHTDLMSDLSFKTLYLAMNRQGNPFIWPVRLPGEDGRVDEWNRVAREAAEMAMSRWVKMSANRSLGTYDVFETTAELPDPNWPTEPFPQLLEVAFRGRTIETPDHPVVQQLQMGI